METDWKNEVPGDLGAGREHPMLMHFPSLPRYNPGKDLEIMFSSQNNQQHWFVLFFCRLPEYYLIPMGLKI